MLLSFAIFLIIYAYVVYYLSRFVVVSRFKKSKIHLVAQLKYYGYFVLTFSYTISFFVFLASLLLHKFNLLIQTSAQLFAAGVLEFIFISLVLMCLVKPKIDVRNYFELNVKFIMLCISSISFLVTILIISSIVFETYKFFSIISIVDFFTGINWSPQDDISDPDIGKKFGIVPLLAGTFLITMIALIVATPIGIFSALFLSEYVGSKTRFVLKPIIEMLSGIPTVVYGYFAALYMGPFIRGMGESWGLNVSSESALAAGVVMGIMIIPYIISLADDMLKSIPTSIRDASFALGATKFETITKIVIPAAKPGLIGAVMLAFSRAIGETMIVTMASGLMANLTVNPLNSVTTVTAQIVSILTGDQEFNSVKTLVAFALAFTLFCLTLVLNLLAHNVMTKYKGQFR
jgi:phosphate transport system permease protein